MKNFILSFLLILGITSVGYSQITTPVMRAHFGVDADLRANFFNGVVLTGNDDWFPGKIGTGQAMIDTTGAAAITARYAVDVPFRRQPFTRRMSNPIFSNVNGYLVLDAGFVRDYHGDDSTVFGSGSAKNGDNPGNWACPVSQGIPDKNDILDMMVHYRRDGSSLTDSLWMMGGLSLDNTTGDRYFDFEMYQTDLVYNRSTLSFSGYGPDAGHTTWQFDASGHIISSGDIIFSAEYQSAALTFIEARIWINKASLSITPQDFDWAGQFDGASSGSTYGYASIQPKTGGAYYTGMQNGVNTPGGPFSIILQDNSIATDYIPNQYVEFSVNLTKLGLDPANSGGDLCGAPFHSLLVKTRASASFTAQLKDFVAPLIFFQPPLVDIQSATTTMCNQGSVAEIHVTNPISTSTYQWTTTDGDITSSSTGSSILVDKPGTYIVTQYLQTPCFPYSRDTVQIGPSSGCIVLPSDIVNLKGTYRNGEGSVTWTVLNNELVNYFEIQRSSDGIHFTTIGHIAGQQSQGSVDYNFHEHLDSPAGSKIYYRVILLNTDHSVKYSHIITLLLDQRSDNITIFPNPAREQVQVLASSTTNTMMKVDLFDASGKRIGTYNTAIQKGNNAVTINVLTGKPAGVYLANIYIGESMYQRKILLVNSQ